MSWWHGILLGVGIAVAVLLSFMVGRCSKASPCIVEERVDTLLIRDTIRIVEPRYVAKRVVERVPYPITDTMRLHDTLVMWLDREQIRWEDSLAVVYASGINPKVDSVIHYTSQMVITDTKVVERVKKTRWGLGVQVGGGVVYANGQFSVAPYVGVGVSYNLLSW